MFDHVEREVVRSAKRPDGDEVDSSRDQIGQLNNNQDRCHAPNHQEHDPFGPDNILTLKVGHVLYACLLERLNSLASLLLLNTKLIRRGVVSTIKNR